MEWIKKWDGKTNSHAGQLLHDKFNELRNDKENK